MILLLWQECNSVENSLTTSFLDSLPSVGSKGMFNFMEENPIFLLMSIELKLFSAELFISCKRSQSLI